MYRIPWIQVPKQVLPKLDSELGNAKEDVKMRKTLFAMLGLVALGLWALPAVAAPVAGGQVVDGPKMRPDPVSLENRAGKATRAR